MREVEAVEGKYAKGIGMVYPRAFLVCWFGFVVGKKKRIVIFPGHDQTYPGQGSPSLQLEVFTACCVCVELYVFTSHVTHLSLIHI